MDNDWSAGWIVHWPDRFFFSPPFTGHRVEQLLLSRFLRGVRLDSAPTSFHRVAENEKRGDGYIMGGEGGNLVKIRV